MGPRWKPYTLLIISPTFSQCVHLIPYHHHLFPRASLVYPLTFLDTILCPWKPQLNYFLANDSTNPLETLPTRLGLTSRTSEFAMGQPASANQPIPSSFNVMGPNALAYPQSYNPSGDADAREMKEVPGPSTGGSNLTAVIPPSPVKARNNYQSFESLLAVVNSETASGMQCYGVLIYSQTSKYYINFIFCI